MLYGFLQSIQLKRLPTYLGSSMLTTPSHPLPPACPLLRGHLKGCLWRPSKAALLKTVTKAKPITISSLTQRMHQVRRSGYPLNTFLSAQKNIFIGRLELQTTINPFTLSVSQRCVYSIMQLFPSWMQFALHHHALALLCNKNISNIHIHAADCIPIFCLLHFDKIVFRCKSGLAPVSFWTHSRTWQ